MTSNLNSPREPEQAEALFVAFANTLSYSRGAAVEHIAATVRRRKLSCDFQRVAGYSYTESREGLTALRQRHAQDRRAVPIPIR